MAEMLGLAGNSLMCDVVKFIPYSDKGGRDWPCGMAYRLHGASHLHNTFITLATTRQQR